SRTVALVAAHGGDAAPDPRTIDELSPLLDVSARALARVLATRQRAATASIVAKRAETEGYEIEVSVSDVATKRAQLDKLREQGAWAELAEAIRELVRDGMEHGDPDEDERLDLLLELGRVEADHLLNPERAIEAWRRAQEIDAGEPRILDALEQLFVQQGRWDDCIELLEKRVALADSDRQRVATLLNLATLAHDKLGDDARAIAAYEKILELDPAHEIAARELEQLYTDGGHWAPLVQLLLERADR